MLDSFTHVPYTNETGYIVHPHFIEMAHDKRSSILSPGRPATRTRIGASAVIARRWRRMA